MSRVVWIAFGLLVISCGSNAEPASGPSPLAVSENGDTVLVNDTWKACEVVDDCVQVETSCNGCCGVEAIEVGLESSYVEERDALCADYEGGECDCEFPDVAVMCIDQLCTLVPR